MARLLLYSTFLWIFVCLIRFGVCGEVNKPVVLAVFPVGDDATTNPHGGVSVRSMKKTRLRLVGTNLVRAESVRFTTSQGTTSTTPCFDGDLTKIFNVGEWDNETSSAIIKDVQISSDVSNSQSMYICINWAGNNNEKGGVWDHQGTRSWLSLQVEAAESGPLLPLWLQISIIAVLLVLSGLFSGLNLGLMSLDQTELSIIQKVGSETEKKHAKRISPLRNKGNFLLCTLLLGNVMVNSTFTILFDNLTNGLIAIISSTFGIVVFGEIIPQAICSRHGLAVGAKTCWLTKFFMVVTFPLSFPISLILDKVLGEEMGQVYNKEKLQELIRMTADQRVLRDNEANIISGALQLTNKCVGDVMTKIEDVYMLDINTELTFETLTEILRHGYTRIPVYDGHFTTVVNLLNTKDLALIDPDDKTSISTVCKFYDHKPLFVEPEVTLDEMLQEFLKGNSHMAIVQKLHNTSNDKDPYYENTGVVTLEDVIEEILQSEIIDETDRMTDNREKKPLTQQKDYSLFPSDQNRSKLPRQLEFVAFQFLASNVEAFSSNNLHKEVLKILMKKNIVVDLTPTTPVSPKNFIFQKGVSSDKFVLILQGTVEVTIGTENMVFESGPFSTFGSECINSVKRNSTPDLKGREYVPDFSVRAVTHVQYLCIQRSHYLAAIRTTKMIRSHVFTDDDTRMNDHFDMEFAKLAQLDKNNSNRIIDVHAPRRKLTNSLRSQASVSRGSTSSLNKIFAQSNKDDTKTRMKRCGSDAMYSAYDLVPDDDQNSSKATPDAVSNSSVDNSDLLGAKSKALPAVNNNLQTQTSEPFTPHLGEDGGVTKAEDKYQPITLTLSTNNSEPARLDPSLDSRDAISNTKNGKSGFGSMSTMTMEQLERIPLVEVVKGGQWADGDTQKVFSKSVEDISDCEKGPVEQDDSNDKSTLVVADARL